MSIDQLGDLTREFEQMMQGVAIDDQALEMAAGSGRLGEGRSTAGDGTSNPQVNCTCCCN